MVPPVKGNDSVYQIHACFKMYGRGREGGREGGRGGEEREEGIILRYGNNYGVGAYGMEWVHNKEPSGAKPGNGLVCNVGTF